MNHGLKLLSAAALALAAVPAGAQDLRIGVASEVTSIDPHFHNVGPNNSLSRHIFQSLVTTDETQKLMPELATAWQAPSTTRPGNSSCGRASSSPTVPISRAKDVVYTLCRIPTVENSPSPFTVYTRGFEAIETPDPLPSSSRRRTRRRCCPNNLSTLGILSARPMAATT